MRIGVEVGGTFTDLVVSTDDGHVARTVKVLSTPAAPAVGVIDAILASGVPLPEIGSIVHGSTVATNTVLERKGARTALVTTKGFRDVINIQRQAKAKLYDLFYKQPTPLVSRDRIGEVPERVTASGAVQEPLDEAEALRVLRQLLEESGAQSLAVSFLHSYRNPVHEQRLAALVAEHFPQAYLTLSSDVLPQFREYERTSTCVMSAYVKPVIDSYLGHLESELAQRNYQGAFSIVQSNGGTVPASAARRHAVKTILSGPAAGVIGASIVAGRVGIPNIITLDMGGTSTDVSLVSDGEPKVTTECKISGLPLKVPMVDIVTVGAGGGSISWLDSGDMLHVGPQSAGADPGPACYGRGGQELTVTDVNVLVGLIRPHMFFGGKLRLDVDGPRRALVALAQRTGLAEKAVADGIIRLVNFNMAQAIRLVSTERGLDPREYTLVAFGGSGPLHAAALAEELDIRRVLVPRHPGLLSAYGLLMADTKQDYVQTVIANVRDVSPTQLRAIFDDLEARAIAEFKSYGIAPDQVTIACQLDVRYHGQAYEITVPVDDFVHGDRDVAELDEVFHLAHERRFGHRSGRDAVEVVNCRVNAVALSRFTSAGPNGQATAGQQPIPERGEIAVGGHAIPCDYWLRDRLSVGFTVEGPAVVEEDTATSFIPSGWRGRVDADLNILLERS